MIEFEQFGNALLTLAEGRKLYEACFGFFLPSTYKPWLQVWYCSDKSHADIANLERREKRRLKRLEKVNKKKQKEQKDLQSQTLENLHAEVPGDQTVAGLQTQ